MKNRNETKFAKAIKTKKDLRNIRKNSDTADAILTMGVIFIMFLLLCAGFAVDLQKAVWAKGQYQQMGQDATTAGTRLILSNGGIQESGVKKAVDTYMARFTGVNADGGVSTKEATVGARSSVCNKVDVNGTEKNAPYMELTLSKDRAFNTDVNTSVKYVSEGGASPVAISGVYNPAQKYHVLNARIWDSAPNLIMNMFGRPCQQIISDVSSVSFGSQEDLKDLAGSNSTPGTIDDPGTDISGTDPITPGISCTPGTFQWSSNTSVKWMPIHQAQKYKISIKNSDGSLDSLPDYPNYYTTGYSLSGHELDKNNSSQTVSLSVYVPNSSTGVYEWQPCLQVKGVSPTTCSINQNIIVTGISDPLAYRMKKGWHIGWSAINLSAITTYSQPGDSIKEVTMSSLIGPGNPVSQYGWMYGADTDSDGVPMGFWQLRMHMHYPGNLTGTVVVTTNKGATCSTTVKYHTTE